LCYDVKPLQRLQFSNLHLFYGLTWQTYLSQALIILFFSFNEGFSQREHLFKWKAHSDNLDSYGILLTPK